MPEFWSSCDYRHLIVNDDGRLIVTDDFLREFLFRPELAPVPAADKAELAVHQSLCDAPRRDVSASELNALADTDARENYRIWLRFRDRLLAADTIESCYMGLFAGEGVDVPPLFVQQLTQVILRHLLGADADPLAARAAEMLFRPQKISVQEDGTVMAADEATVEAFSTTGGFGSLGELLRRQQTPPRAVDLDVLSRENADAYWERDEQFDWAVSLNRGQPVLDRLCRILERWVAHFLAAEVRIAPRRSIEDERWVWHVGLDAQASGILNDLYRGVEVDDARLGRLLCLFQLEFANAGDMRPAVAGCPVYLAMAMDGERRLQLKPQNLLLNLPLAPKS